MSTYLVNYETKADHKLIFCLGKSRRDVDNKQKFFMYFWRLIKMMVITTAITK